MERSEDEAAALQGQAEAWRLMFAFADSMALKCAIELQIPDIIHSRAHPITLSEIASSISNAPSVNLPFLERILRLLVRKRIFTADRQPNGGDTLYGPTHVSKWLQQQGSELSLAPMFLLENHPLALAPWHYFSQCVREGGIAFQKAHGVKVWDFAAKKPEFNRIFNDGMACTAKIPTQGILTGYKDGFASIGSLVDVGGGTGGLIAEIVRSFPHIKGINFDLPHVVATAPEYEGVSHLGGDMFQAVPKADAVIMKWIMHDWGDEDCVKILKNCRKAIEASENGKIMIVDVVLKPDGKEAFDDVGVAFDLVMIAHASGGKERTEVEWKKLLEDAGFPRYKVINIPALPSLIEAYPASTLI